MVFILGLVLAAILWIVREQYFPQPPGFRNPPRASLLDPFFGLDYILRPLANIETFRVVHQKYGKTHYTTPLLAPLQIFTADPLNVHQIMSNGRMWGNSWRHHNMKQFAGTGFLNTDGDESRNARKMLRPCFSKVNVTDLDFMQSCMQAVLSKIKAAKHGTGLDLTATLYEAFMDSALHFVLGSESTDHDHLQPHSIPRFRTVWEDGLRGMGMRLALRKLIWLFPASHYSNICSQVHAFIDYHIDHAATESTKGSNAGRRSAAETFTSMMDDKTYTRSQLIQTLIGAQETTSTLVCNALEMLARHPKVWQEVRVEVKQKTDELRTFEQLRDNKLIQNILLECLRLRPVFASLKRMALHDTTLPVGGGTDGTSPIYVPKGTLAQSSFYVLNRDPDIFGTDAESFDAHRFDRIKPSSKEFMPFGTGSRSCLGKEKAQVEAAYVLARLAQKFEVLEWKGPEEARIGLKMLTRNLDGCKVSFRTSKVE